MDATLALGWLVYETTHSELATALFTGNRLASLLLGPLGSILADPFNRIRLLIVACGRALGAVSTVALVVESKTVPSRSC